MPEGRVGEEVGRCSAGDEENLWVLSVRSSVADASEQALAGFGVGVEPGGLYTRPELAQVRADTAADVERGLNLTIINELRGKIGGGTRAQQLSERVRHALGQEDQMYNSTSPILSSSSLMSAADSSCRVLLEVYSVPSDCSARWSGTWYSGWMA